MGGLRYWEPPAALRHVRRRGLVSYRRRPPTLLAVPAPAVMAVTKWLIAVARAGAFQLPHTRTPPEQEKGGVSGVLASPSQGRRAPAIILGTFGLH